MAISVNWSTKVISVPQSYLTLVSGSVYELDTNQFRLDLKSLEDDEVGIPHLDTHRHNTEVTLAGATYSRFFEIINGYTITFENLQYAVNLIGSNNNIADVANVNQVSIRSQNSAGLITVVSGSGVTAGDVTDIATAVWDEDLNGKTAENRLTNAEKKAKIAANR